MHSVQLMTIKCACRMCSVMQEDKSITISTDSKVFMDFPLGCGEYSQRTPFESHTKDNIATGCIKLPGL